MSPTDPPDQTREPLQIQETTVAPGSREKVDIPIARLPTQTEAALPVEVIHGEAPGPRVWVSGALHGDELIGVEIVRELRQRLNPTDLTGTVYCVPIVNIFGFLEGNRYLPDRRDLNRSFPGLKQGSLAARLAHQFMQTIVKPCDLGIDLHAGSNDRFNLPQVRGNLDDERTLELARAFAPPIIIDKRGPRGSLRREAVERGTRVLLFEGGEPHRFDEETCRHGLHGILRTLQCMEMLEAAPSPPTTGPPARSSDRRWIRAKRSGLLNLEATSGDRVQKGETLGTIGDALRDGHADVKAPCDGMLISHQLNPLVYQGDALLHLAELEND
jgi:predicted deacylase